MSRKAAVVIGVNKTGSLQPLKSAAPGAKEVAKWLKAEGYTVKCLTDKNGAVTGQMISDAIKKFVVVPARYHLLLVYFSGHGDWHTRSDHWLLSGAPVDTSEAINLNGAMDLARYSGIPNVVFISDACRSLPNERTGALVRGIDAFPNYQDFNTVSKIDYFKASCESRSAYESEFDGKPRSILTYAIKSAFESPSPDMVRDVKEGGCTVQVVPNRKLEDYLQPKVNELLVRIGSNEKMIIDVNVPSSDNIYISRILGTVSRSRPVTGPVPSIGGGSRGVDVPTPKGMDDYGFGGGVADMELPLHTRRDEVDFSIFKDNVGTINVPSTTRLSVGQVAANTIALDLSTRVLGTDVDGRADILSVLDTETAAQLRTRLPTGIIDHFKSQTGFLVHGAVVETVTTSGRQNARAEILDSGERQSPCAIIQVWTPVPAVSVLVKLADGRSAVLAGLFGYIGYAIFDKDGLANVSYIPSSNNERWQRYKNKRDKVDRLRALVSLAVEHNTFKVRSDRDAERLADEIRMEKAIDPTLGVYAAHAFNQAGNDKRVASVLQYMHDDLQADLFDVRVLASRIKDKPVTGNFIVPFCPMLTQTWNLLRPREIEIPEVLQKAEAYLCDSLWTTFRPEATDFIIQSIEKGELI